MTSFAFIVPCKGRLEHLQRSLPPRLGLPDVENLVVDYDCPDGAGDWVQEHAPEARVVRVEGAPYYNASAARNVGAAMARADWLVFVHADVIVGRAFLSQVQARCEPGVFLEAPRVSDAAGTLVVSQEDFRRVGGYDDTYEGWGEEDIDFRDLLVESGLRPLVLSEGLFETIDHDDELRTQFFEQKDRVVSLAAHRVYRAVKFDLLRLRGEAMSEEMRRDIWATITSQVASAHESDEAEDLIVSLSDQAFCVPSRSEEGQVDLGDAWRMKRSVVYELAWRPNFSVSRELEQDELSG